MKSTYSKSHNLAFGTSQRGASLMVALFLLVILSVLAARLINVLSDSSRSIAVEVYGTRALMAAQSGADLALVKLFPLDNGVGAGCGAVPTSDSGEFADNAGLLRCSATIGCQQQAIPDAVGSVLYTITVTGFCAGGGGEEAIRAERIIELEARGLSL
ncbi:hypothetical protein GCM10011369_26170 [Neiella marina]|uniref:MSHA biogenesis protein MshP n=1 Tax=Neiella marina TaxID=508461 RepID=A0A8J2XN96_9GAMM|nr:hypothetical protein [Neiella marina]GGA82933.1 hypothetical protein GCM10011369_26170 [Neiella marina]